MSALLRGSLVSLLLRGVGAAATLGFSILAGRLLGAADYGRFELALTIVTITTVVSRLGLGAPLVRFCASPDLLRDGLETAPSSILRSSVYLSLPVAVAATLLLSWGAPHLGRILMPGNSFSATLRTLAFAVPPLTVSYLVSQALRGKEHIALSVTVERALTPVAGIALVAGIPLIFGIEVDLSGFSLIYVTATLVTVLVGYVGWRLTKSTSHTFRFTPRSLLERAIPLFQSEVLTLAIHWAPIIVLSLFADAESLGRYTAAERLVRAFLLVTASVNTIASPLLSRHYGSGDRREFRLVCQTSTVLMLVLSLPIFLVIFAWPELILGLFGAEFQEAGNVLRILAVGHLVNVLTGPAGYAVIMVGREDVARNLTALAAAVLLVLAVVGIPRFGAIGAAVASMSGTAVMHIGAAVAVAHLHDVVTLPNLTSAKVWRMTIELLDPREGTRIEDD